MHASFIASRVASRSPSRPVARLARARRDMGHGTSRYFAPIRARLSRARYDDDDDDDDDDARRVTRRVTRRATRANANARPRSVSPMSTVSSSSSSEEAAAEEANEGRNARASPSPREPTRRRRRRRDGSNANARARASPSSPEAKAVRARERMRKFIARGSKANERSRYDYRSRAKGVMGFEKFSDDDEDSAAGDEDSWMVDEEEEEVDEEGEEEGDDGEEDDEDAFGARRRRRKRTNPFESGEDEENEAPEPTRRRLIRKMDVSDARDEKTAKTAKTKTPEKRSSARVKTQRAKKSREAAQHAESLMKSSLDDVMLRQEEQDRLSNESASSATDDDDGFIVDDDGENEDEDEVMNVTPRKKRLSLGAHVDEALRSDDGPALIRALARLDEVPRQGRVLISAAAYNASSVVPMLLGKGIRIDGALGKRGDARVHLDDVSEALHAACERGHVDFVHAVRNCIGLAQFCRGGPAGGWPRNACGGTLVHSAANNEAASAECVAAAIMAESSSGDNSKMALPSWTTLDDDAQGGRTALMIAVSAGDGWENCVAELVRDIKRFGPAKTRAVLQLKEPRNGCTAIHFAASSGAVKLLQIFISECEASVNAKDYASATPLHYASMVGKTEAVRLLLHHHADRLARDESGWIPLLYANFHSERDAVLELLRERVVPQLEMMCASARGDATEKTVQQVQKVFELLATIPEYYDSINECVARDRATVFPIIEILRASNIMSILDMKNRLAILRTNYVQPAVSYSTGFKVTKQGDLWKSLVRRYQSNKTMFLGSSVSCSYEAYGSSGPGVTRDVFTSIAKELCDADLEHVQLFEQDDAQTYVLKRGLDRASRKMELVMFGEVMALVLLNCKNALLPIPFSSLFMRRVLSSSEKEFSLDGLENAYPQEVKSIRYVLECDDPETLETLSLSFTDEKGVLVDVTSANRARFASSKRREMTQRIIDDDSASDIRDGLLHVLQPAALGMLSPEEFILAVCGSHDIDVDEWRRFADAPSSQQLSWLWNIVGRMKTDEKALLLQFSTGSALVPVGGFAKLSPRWSVHFNEYMSAAKLPTTSTCFNTMNCPKYPSEEIFEQRLMTAIRHGAAGFAFG